MGRRGSNEGSIYQRSDDRWVSYVRLPDGRKKFFYGSTRREVQTRLTQALSDRDQGILIATPNITVAQYLERWLADAVQPNLRYSTHRAYRGHVKQVEPLIGRLKLNELDGPRLQAAYNALLQQGLSAATVQHVHRVLHKAMRQAILWGLLGRNPVDAATPPRPKRIEMKIYTEEQVRRLLESTEGDLCHELWAILVSTGLRVGEALGLTWADVDLTAGTAIIQRAAQRQVGRGVVFIEPKTSRSRRSVPLPTATSELLRRLRIRRQEESLATGQPWSTSDPIFVSTSGRVPDPTWVVTQFHRLTDRAGLPRIRVHDLRHTAATHLLTHGVHPKVVQELLGHSTITLTLDTYSHVLPSMTREASRQMDVFFSRPTREHYQHRRTSKGAGSRPVARLRRSSPKTKPVHDRPPPWLSTWLSTGAEAGGDG